MSRKKQPEQEPEQPVQSSTAAGACVLVALSAGAAGGAFAVSPTVGILGLWTVGAGALWRAARRRMVSDMPATPPPEGERPSCDECAGHTLISVTPLDSQEGSQKGMLIYKTTPADRPNHTHIHLARQP